MGGQHKPLITGPKWLCRVVSVLPFPLRPGAMDLLFLLERRFDVKLQRQDFPWSAVELDAVDFTAGELHDWVCNQLRSQGKGVPRSSWWRVQRVLAGETGKSPWLVRRESYVQRDLRFFDGG